MQLRGSRAMKEALTYKSISQTDIAAFVKMIGQEHVLVSEEMRNKYGRDETEDLLFPPEVVLKPDSAAQISSILSYCNQEWISVTPIGGRTGLSGGALAVEGGVGLSLERLNRILHIDEKNLQATVEPGVITQVFQEAVEEKGLFYPPDPSSRGSCFIGGNLAECAGGPKAVKYGVTRDYVLNLEVVLPNGKIIWTGANVLKNSTGYNLTHLLIGSEGTLGVITKAVFRLLPLPKHDVLMLVPFFSAEQACEAVADIFRCGIIPSGLEFMERDAIDWTLKFVKEINLPIAEEVQAHLLIELDGEEMDVLMKDAEQVTEVVEKYEVGEVLFADTPDQKKKLWKLRRSVGEAVKAHSVYKEEDTVVPRYHLPELLNGVKRIGKAYGFRSVCYGHAGDGNLHVNIIRGDLSDDHWQNVVIKGIEEIFALVVKLGGTLSGEHGIGYVQKRYMKLAFPEETLALMRGIKSVFDPNCILNPGKIFEAPLPKKVD